MSLRIYNTLSRALEDFSPLIPGQVRMYVCGMTIYDLCHVGHARMMMAFDTVQRWLKASGYEVIFVRNITDIDDKIIKRAVERGISLRALTDEMVAGRFGLGATHPRAARHRVCTADDGHDQPFDRQRLGLPSQQRRRGG
jgi:cysteinyl-tRNA synthetase